MLEGVALLVEPCPLCGRPRTIVAGAAGECLPVCMCCGGGGLGPDRGCRHHGPQAELPLARPAS